MNVATRKDRQGPWHTQAIFVLAVHLLPLLRILIAAQSADHGYEQVRIHQINGGQDTVFTTSTAKK